MKKFTSVCLVITAILVILGISACAVGVIMGAGFQNIRGVWNSGKWGGWHWFADEDWSDPAYREQWENAGESVQTYPAEGIREIEISLRHGSLDIEEADTEEISVILEKDNGMFEVSAENGTLRLEDQRTGAKARYDYDITLKLPKGMELDEIKIENNAGILEVDDIGLKVKSAEITVDAGEAVIENLDAEKFTIDVGAGSAEVERLKAKEATVDCGVGTIDLTLYGSEKDYNYEVNCGLGNIAINRENYTSLGKEIRVDNQAKKNISLDCGVGEIVLQTVKESE